MIKVCQSVAKHCCMHFQFGWDQKLKSAAEGLHCFSTNQHSPPFLMMSLRLHPERAVERQELGQADADCMGAHILLHFLFVFLCKYSWR